MPSAGQIVAEAWESALERHEQRERDQVTTLHDWTRKRNGRWVDEGWTHARPLATKWLYDRLNASAFDAPDPTQAR